MQAFLQISSDLASKLSEEIRQQLGILLKPDPRSEDFGPVFFVLDHAVTIEIHPVWNGEDAASHATSSAVIRVRSTQQHARHRSLPFRPDFGQWPIQKIVSAARSFQDENRRFASLATKTLSERERLRTIGKQEIPQVPSGMYLLRLANGRYRITITELTLPLEPTRQLVRFVEENTGTR